jgi:hypothetical protein
MTTGAMADGVRLIADGHRHFRLQIVDCRFAGPVSRELQADSGHRPMALTIGRLEDLCLVI